MRQKLNKSKRSTSFYFHKFWFNFLEFYLQCSGSVSRRKITKAIRTCSSNGGAELSPFDWMFCSFFFYCSLSFFCLHVSSLNRCLIVNIKVYEQQKQTYYTRGAMMIMHAHAHKDSHLKKTHTQQKKKNTQLLYIQKANKFISLFICLMNLW